MNVYAHTISGKSDDTSEEKPSETRSDNLQKEYHFVTNKHDYSALLSAPKWLDGPIVMYPEFSQNAKMVFVVLGIDPNFHVDDKEETGVLSNRDETEEKSGISFSNKSYLGWTAVDLFEGKGFLQTLGFARFIYTELVTKTCNV